jgi:putative FmdB family regulatory protein
MPLYEFKCPKCNVKFEAQCNLSTVPKSIPCRTPKCKGRGELVEFSVPAKRNPRHGIQS